MQTYTHTNSHIDNPHTQHTHTHTHTHEQYNYFFVVDKLLQHSTAVEKDAHCSIIWIKMNSKKCHV